jgi:tRNA-2-methylthio-N6-dimethylallyladenosine synthase
MRRSYRSDRYLKILENVRSAIPHASITTDIIVGFPGESEEDFQATLDLCTQAQFAAAYTYQYSIRPGTPAASMPDQVSAETVGHRYTRLHEHQQLISLGVNKGAIGKQMRVLVGEYEGRRDARESRLTGKSEDFRLVHFADSSNARAGDFVDVQITDASAHYLIGEELQTIATRGGDAYELRHSEKTSSGVSLGIPTVRV